MHQTFYIDVDEEISSVIDRLKKSMSVDNYFVAPKRAIFLQSIVNLKLLKREAEKIRKHVVLVTQDEIASSMALRSGLEVQRSLDGLDDEVLEVEPEMENEEVESVKEEVRIGADKATRLNNVGSNEYYDVNSQSLDMKQRRATKMNGINPANIHNRAAHPRHHLENQKHLAKNKVNGISGKNISPDGNHGLRATGGYRHDLKEYSYKLENEKEKSLEKMFSNDFKKNPADESHIENKKTKNYLFIFIMVCLVLFGGVAAYLYVPSANLVINPSVQITKIDADVVAVDNTRDAGIIPVKSISSQEQLTLQYEATGKSSSSGKKAKGTIVIYNEFDGQPQTLVSTTRLQSESGKIFRLLKTVVVPGTSNIGGELKPGAISADVVADEPGDEYNVDPGKFTIPGFKGGPKFDKFYAKSTAAMTGGTSEGDGTPGVSQSDIENAKQKTEAALKEKIASMIKAEMNSEDIELPQAEKITITKSSANAKIGEAVSTFDYTVTADVSALIFSQKDVESIISDTDAFKKIPQNSEKLFKKIEYGSVEPNFEKATLNLKVHADIEAISNIDVESLKKEILGKNENELATTLKKYQEIKSANVVFWPTFIPRIPQYPQRVQIQIENKNGE